MPTTTNYSLTTIPQGQKNWGTSINTNFEIIDTELKEREDGISLNTSDITNLKNIGANIADNITHSYNTIALMKADTKLVVGNRVKTMGYYTSNDGGGAYYIITSDANADDGGSYHLLSNGLKAKLIHNGIINIKQFGAKVDGTTNDSTKIQALINYLGANGGGTVDLGVGTFVASITLNSEKVFINGRGNMITTWLVPASNYGITISFVTQKADWNISKISNFTLKAQTVNSGYGISFGNAVTKATYDEYVGRYLIDNIEFIDLQRHVVKLYGNIGNEFRNCIFQGGDFQYYAKGNVGSVENGDDMHSGCDTFYKCQFKESNLACVYINNGLTYCGQHIFRDCIFELNYGMNFFIKNYDADSTQPTLLIDNCWKEINCRNETVTIDSIVYSTRELYLENVMNARIKRTYVNKIALVNSVLYCEECSNSPAMSQNYDVDADSNFIVDKFSTAKNIVTSFKVKNFIDINCKMPYGNGRGSSVFKTVHRMQRTKGYSNVVVASYPLNVDGTNVVGALAGARVTDGVLYDSCFELTYNATASIGTETTVQANKYVVWTATAKRIYGTNPTFYISSVGDPVTINYTWDTFCGMIFVPDVSYVCQPKIACVDESKIRIGEIQILQFDSKAEAIDYLNSLYFAEV